MRCLCAAFGLICLTACGAAEDGNASEAVAQASPADRDGRIPCATSGRTGFERACTIEQASGAEGTVLTIRAPDGSFRRLLVTADGSGVIAADGAEPTVVTPRGASEIEVAVGGDRYRIPATVRNVTP